MLHVIATIELHSGTRDRFLVEFRKIVPLVRAEAGCLEYGPTIDAVTDLPVQGPQRIDSVTVVEQWQNLEHLKDHLVAPHMMEYRPKVIDFVKRVQLQILEPI